jgi:predicted acetylornithine/succinylornithine family transaminase
VSVDGIDELRALEARYAMPTYARAPVEFVRGRGCLLWDSAGREYIDFFSGLSVHNAGHCNPSIVAAIRDQVGELAGSSNLYYSSATIELHAKLSESSLGGRVFLCNSGTEANECAIKLARRHAHRRGIDRPEIVVLEGGFHGRTLGALSATVRLADPDLFGPLLEGFVEVPRDDPGALAAAVGTSTAAVLLEPVQGESGVYPIGGDVLTAAREACDGSGALLVFDEVQTGMGRTGHLWAYQAGPVAPDVLTAAKALGGGLPVGACVTAPAVGEGLGLGEHGSTFGGGPVGARAALAALELLSEPALLASVRELGELLERRCLVIEGVEGVRRRGLMVGLGLRDGIDSRGVAEAALACGLVVNAPNPRTVRLLPPLVAGEAEIADGCDRLAEAFGRTRRCGA